MILVPIAARANSSCKAHTHCQYRRSFAWHEAPRTDTSQTFLFPAFWLSSTHCTVATYNGTAFVKWSGCLLAAAGFYLYFRCSCARTYSALRLSTHTLTRWQDLRFELVFTTAKSGNSLLAATVCQRVERWRVRYVHKSVSAWTAHVQWHSRSEPMNTNSSIQKLHLFRPPIYFADRFCFFLIHRFFFFFSWITENYRSSKACLQTQEALPSVALIIEMFTLLNMLACFVLFDRHYWQVYSELPFQFANSLIFRIKLACYTNHSVNFTQRWWARIMCVASSDF